MTQIKQHTLQSGERILLVELHVKCDNITFDSIDNTLYFHGEIPENVQSLFARLPKGNWQLIGLSDEITEEQAASLIDTTLMYKKHKVKSYKYKSYIDGFIGFETSLESFKSLMQSLGCEGRYAILKEVK